MVKRISMWSMFIAFLATAAPAQPPAVGDHWPQWRGPAFNGFAPNGDPPLKWDDKTNVKWKTPIPGKGTSTPVIWGDQIFLLTAIDTRKPADPKDIPKADPKFEKKTKPPTTYHQYVVLCLDRKTGKILWQQVATEQVPHEGRHETHSFAAFSPVTDGKHLYVSFGSRGVFCFDLTGKKIWQREFGLMNTRLGWGEGASPALHGDTLIVPWDQEADSFIVALDAKSGATKWKKDRDEKTSWATPLIVTHKGRTQVIVNGTNKVRSYDIADGKVIWECGGQTVNAIPSPVLLDDFVIVMSGYRGAAAHAIPLDSTGDVTGKVLWQYEQGTPYVPSPVLTGGQLWFTQANLGMLTVLDARTGKAVMDRVRLPGVNSLYASPAAARDRIYLSSRDGTTLVLKRGDKLEVLATNRMSEGIDASPAIIGKQLFLRGEQHLFCIEE